MKLDFKTILIIILVAGLAISRAYKPDPEVKVEYIVTSPKEGKVKNKVDSVKTDTVYITKYKTKTKTKVLVDSTYKARYEQAIKDNDSLKAKNLFLESIAINTVKSILVDDKNITIEGKFKTRGKLLEYDVKYVIKSDSILYIPKKTFSHPNLSLVLGVDVLSIDSKSLTPGSTILNGRIGLKGKKGGTVTFIIGTDGTKGVGYTFRPLKLSRR